MLSDANSDRLFDYMEGRLSEDDRTEFEELLQSDDELRSAWQALRELESAGADWHDVAVPAWSRLRGVTAGPAAGQFNVLSWLSMATSTVAIMLVLFSAQLSFSDNGFSLTFGNGGGSSMLQMERRLTEFERDSTDYVNQRFELMEERSRATNRRLLAAALEYSRAEREDDLRLLATSWSLARDSDRMQVEELQDEQFDDRMAIQQLYTRLPTIR